MPNETASHPLRRLETPQRTWICTKRTKMDLFSHSSLSMLNLLKNIIFAKQISIHFSEGGPCWHGKFWNNKQYHDLTKKRLPKAFCCLECSYRFCVFPFQVICCYRTMIIHKDHVCYKLVHIHMIALTWQNLSRSNNKNAVRKGYE